MPQYSLNSGAAVLHQGEEEYLLQCFAVVQNQAGVGDPGVKEDRIEGLLFIALPGIKGKALLREAAGLVATDADAAGLIEEGVAVDGIELQMGWPFRLHSLPVILRVVHQLDPGKFFIDLPSVQGVLVEGAPHVDSRFVGKETLRVRNEGKNDSVFIAFLFPEINKIGRGHGIAAVSLPVEGGGAHHGGLVHRFLRRLVLPVQGGDILPGGVYIFRRTGIGEDQRLHIKEGILRGFASVQRIADRKALRRGKNHLRAALIEASRRQEYRLVHGEGSRAVGGSGRGAGLRELRAAVLRGSVDGP